MHAIAKRAKLAKLKDDTAGTSFWLVGVKHRGEKRCVGGLMAEQITCDTIRDGPLADKLFLMSRLILGSQRG